MAVKKIIVAFDGSPDSKKALAIATELAQHLKAKIILVSVDSIPTTQATGSEYNWVPEYKKTDTEKIEGGRKYCEVQGLEVYTQLLHGRPGEEIIKYAQKQNAYMIVSGKRGTGGFSQLLLGSVAHNLVTHSDIPVLIVK